MTDAWELSELQALDFGLGRTMAAAFAGLSASGPADYREFVARASNKKIFRHDFDAPQDFISAYVGGRKGQTVGTNTKSNRLDLPVIAYCRKPGIRNDEDRGGVIHERIRWDESLENAFKLSVLPVTVEYKIMMLAWDKQSLDKLQLAWYSNISNHRSAHHIFNVVYNIDDQPFEVKAFIKDSKNIETTDISLTKEEGRIFGVEQQITVTSQILYGEPVEVGDLELIFNLVGYYA
jgi:hypothetical protein